MKHLKDLVIAWIAVGVAIAVAVAVLPGIDIDWSPFSYAILAALWAAINVSLGTFVRIASTPIRIITLGLFSVVINAIVLVATAAISDALSVDGFLDAVVAAIVISIVNTAFMAMYHRRRDPSEEGG